MTLRAGRWGRLVTAALSKGILGPGLGLSLGLGMLGGCYQGEWRLGAEVPIATTSRLLPVRTLETWELSQTQTPFVIQLKGTSTPRCRHALYGKARRVDTGKFERVGGGVWKTLAITTGALGGAAAGFGGAGWVASSGLLPSSYGAPILYGVGGGLVVGGLASCFTALARPAKLRYALCGILTGLGASIVGGALVGTPSGATMANPMGTTLISPSLLQTAMFAGGGLIGVSIVTGIVANIWSGYDDRVRNVDLNNQTLWDEQQSETTCGDVTPLYGRTVGLDIVAERVQNGLGSDAVPIRLRVSLGRQSTQPVDLRPLRQALSSCGALRVQLSPDVVYEEFNDDYMPPVTPDQLHLSSPPVFGHIVPKEGITLAASETRHRQMPATTFFHGVSADQLIAIDRHCRGEGPGLQPGKKAPAVAGARPPSSRPPSSRPPVPSPPEPAEPDQVEAPPMPPQPQDVPPPPPSALPPEDVFVSTPGLTGPHPTDTQTEEGECSLQAERARFNDCEAQCGRALSLGTCLLDFRKCYLESRGSTQVQRDRDQCSLNWEQCLYRTNVSPASWRRCVEGCSEANVPYSCQQRAERRNGP